MLIQSIKRLWKLTVVERITRILPLRPSWSKFTGAPDIVANVLHSAWHTIDSVVPNLADALGEWLGASVHIDIVAPLGSDDGQIHVKRHV